MKLVVTSLLFSIITYPTLVISIHTYFNNLLKLIMIGGGICLDFVLHGKING